MCNCTACVDLLLLNLNEGNRNLQYNCHQAKIVDNTGVKKDQIITFDEVERKANFVA